MASSSQQIATLISDAEKLPFFPVDAWAENQESAILQTQSIAQVLCQDQIKSFSNEHVLQEGIPSLAKTRPTISFFMKFWKYPHIITYI